ncbi:TetR/AcrR family transcriptional regulator [Thermomonospora umbrina]|uniref:TetR family transcriptional regulator n=1 Tax=Thermomonospora umbrina TaxID=111806 RepID=A0A3D9T7U6_9ACTN|nr:TetR/AcrR family transcriptional regulator [Thermomonospora umbrina]REE99841.1 TetR family transcriptional regulator [Thermomonospora umbrina]
MGRASGRERAGLPSGRHHLSREHVVDNQLGRVLQAVVEVAGTKGYGALTVDRIVAHSGVSRRTFYELFRNKDEAFIGAYDTVVNRMSEAIVESMETADDPAAKMRAGLSEYLRFLSADPLAARVAVVEVLAAGPEAVARRDATRRRFVRTIAAFVRELDPDWPEPELTAEGMAGAVRELVYFRILRGETETLPALFPGLLRMFVMPRRARGPREAH